MKKILFLVVVLILVAPLSVGAQRVGEKFEPLTGLPALDPLSDGSEGMSNFFNQLYVYAVGAAAIIAVIQIMFAGFRLAYSAGNHSTIEEAKNHIRDTILGLLLILSPTIVFGIINPDILNLRINTTLLSEREQAEMLTCDSFTNLGVVDRDPTESETWSATDEHAGDYRQCCSVYDEHNLTSGVCEHATTNIGGGNYCKCTTIEAGEWHLAFGGGVVVDFVGTFGRGGETTTRCLLAAPDEADMFFPSENACESAYDSSSDISQKIRAGKLRGTSLTGENEEACIAAVENAKKGAVSIRIVSGPTCEEIRAPGQ